VHRLTISYTAPADGAIFDADAFDADYRDGHVPLAAKLPGVRRFVLSHPRPLGPGGAPYLVAELWFDDADSLKAALRSAEGAATAADAEQLVEKHRIASMTMATGEVTELLA